jgi:hypothetical protein
MEIHITDHIKIQPFSYIRRERHAGEILHGATHFMSTGEMKCMIWLPFPKFTIDCSLSASENILVTLGQKRNIVAEKVIEVIMTQKISS